MPIEKHEVKIYEIDFRCDVCGKGYYRPTGVVFPTYPTKYLHKCTVCGAELVVTGHTYPYTEQERIKTDGER